MENISQKDINEIISILENHTNITKGEPLAKKLKSAEIIPALYVMTYLQAVNKVRENTQVPAPESSIENMKKNDFTKFKEALKQNYHLNLDYGIGNEGEFKGLCRLLDSALQRKEMICDYNDSKFPLKKIGRCSCEEHSEVIDHTPVIPWSDELQKQYDHECNVEERDIYEVQNEKPFIDYFNPKTQEVELVLEYDDDSGKWINSVYCYACKKCLEYMQENAEGGVSCDMDSVE